MKINLKIKKLNYIYLIAFFGFLLFSYYFWFRFIRERLPRDIPFNLTLFSFFILCFICLCYIYILYRIYKPANSQNMLLIFRNQILLLFKPFYFLDKILKKNISVTKYLFKCYFFFIKTFNLYKNNNKYIYIYFNILPKIILLVCFIIDIFYFHKFYFFYKVIILGVLPLVINYSVYTIMQYLPLLCNHLDKYYNVIILSTTEEEEEYAKIYNLPCFMANLSYLKKLENEDNVLNVNDFIEWQTQNLIFEYQLYKYTCIETKFARDQYIKKHKLKKPPIWVYEPESDDISKELAKEFRELMPMAYYFKAFLIEYNDYMKPEYLKYDKYFIIIYLLCWIYILAISLHTLNIMDLLQVLKTTTISKEPFSDCNMFL